MTLKLRHDSSGYLTCEHVSVFYLLMLNSGIMGAYTYVVRGGVFCNAQTANFLMLGISLGEGNFKPHFSILFQYLRMFLVRLPLRFSLHP